MGSDRCGGDRTDGPQPAPGGRHGPDGGDAPRGHQAVDGGPAGQRDAVEARFGDRGRGDGLGDVAGRGGDAPAGGAQRLGKLGAGVAGLRHRHTAAACLHEITSEGSAVAVADQVRVQAMGGELAGGGWPDHREARPAQGACIQAAHAQAFPPQPHAVAAGEDQPSVVGSRVDQGINGAGVRR